MYGYCSTCAFMHNFKPTDVSFFGSKCAYIFSILHYFAFTDASALTKFPLKFIYVSHYFSSIIFKFFVFLFIFIFIQDRNYTLT